MAHTIQAGKTLRRLRIVSEPVTDYIRFEWHDAAQLVQAGEDVRWLPRRHTSTLLLPGNDFWMFDHHTVAFTHFSGEGHVLDHEMSTDPHIVAACAAVSAAPRNAVHSVWLQASTCPVGALLSRTEVQSVVREISMQLPSIQLRLDLRH